MKDGSLEQDVAGEVGIAIIMYFKQVKCLLILLFILTLLSLPQLVIFSYHLN